MSQQRHGRSDASPRWQGTDDAAMVNLITTLASGLLLMVPALLLVNQLSPRLGPSLTSTPRALERVSLD